MSTATPEEIYRRSRRPEIAMITNHGYGGPDIPVGGAPDTGGQNYYVNTLAQMLERQGYRVTVFARGGFAHFRSNRMRGEPEHLTGYIRYVYVPGGGEYFIPKEKISIALDEEIDWLDDFIRREAEAKGCRPWQVYEFVNTHYWDAAVLGLRLVERWRNDEVSQSMVRLLEGVVSEDQLSEADESRHWRAMGDVPGFHLGRLLIHRLEQRTLPIEQQVRSAVSSWAASKGLDPNLENALVDAVDEAIERMSETFSPAFERMIASAALGRAILELEPDIDERLKRDLDRLDRHVWTPHSLGELKDVNYRRRSHEVRRALRFCERRSHERMICARTRAITATSVKMAEKLWTHYRVPMEDTYYFPPCVDGQIYRPHADEELAPTFRYLEEISGVSEDELRAGRIVFETSRMDRTKRKDLLLAAFARLEPARRGLYLFIGGGPRNDVAEGLEHQIDFTEALDGRAFLTGAIPDEHMGPLFSLADVYASPSEMEGFGMCVSQAAAAATPIVSSDKIPFSVQHAAGEVEIVQAGDSRALAEALSRVLEDLDAFRGRALGLRERVQSLDWEVKTRDFIEYLRQRGIEVAEGERDD